MSKGLLVVGAMTAYVVGCGGTSVQHAAPPDDTKGRGGTTGSGASGGAPGVGGGRNGGSGAQGGGTVGGGGGSTGGGKGGKGGAPPGVGGTAGASGTAGSAGAPDPDPSCDCTFEDRSFDCTSDDVTVPSVLAVPEQCAGQDMRVKRQYCDDGSTRYTFIEGEENAYRLELDAAGDATYFSAAGYVSPGCGLDSSDFDEGTVTRGMPTDAACFEGCALCQEYEDLPACPVCERDPNDPSGVLQPLDTYCADKDCPATVADALEYLTGSCETKGPGEVHTGCGLVTVERDFGFLAASYTYDVQSGALRGATFQRDYPFGPCRAAAYRAGDIPDGTCSAVSTCTFCESDTAEGGAAGAAGAAGAGDGNSCAP